VILDSVISVPVSWRLSLSVVLKVRQFVVFSQLLASSSSWISRAGKSRKKHCYNCSASTTHQDENASRYDNIPLLLRERQLTTYVAAAQEVTLLRDVRREPPSKTFCDSDGIIPASRQTLRQTYQRPLLRLLSTQAHDPQSRSGLRINTFVLN
jgi:hypothetical protein